MLSGLVIRFIKLYQILLSPVLPTSCRFYPSCSVYSIEAFHRYGFRKGVIMSLTRLCRCHPWHPGGYDPVI